MDKLWFYTKSGSTEKQGPVSDEEMHTLISDGAIGRGDLLWSEGMSEWKPLASITELKDLLQTSNAAGGAGSVPLPDGLLGWMNFIGIATLLMGIFNCLSCVGVITGIFLIIGGAALTAAKRALDGVSTVDISLAPFFTKLKTFMQMMGIMYIITIIMLIGMMIFYFTMFAAMASNILQQ